MSDLAPPQFPRVLIVDSDALVQRCVALALRQAAELRAARDLGGGRALLREGPFDVIVVGRGLSAAERRTLLAEASRLWPRAKLFLLEWSERPALEPPPTPFDGGGLATVLSRPEGLAELAARVRGWVPEAIENAGPG
jgi:DNA-binding response OmpR family regulator